MIGERAPLFRGFLNADNLRSSSLRGRLDALFATREGAVGALKQSIVALVLAALTYGIPSAVGILGNEWTTSIAMLSVVSILTFLLCRVSKASYMYYLVALILTQSVFSGPWSWISGGAIPFAITEAKTISVGVAALVLSRQIIRVLARSRTLSFVLGIYVLAVLLSIRSFDLGMLAYGRNFLLPMILMLVVAAISRDWDWGKRLGFLRDLVIFVTIVLVGGTLLELAVGTGQWRAFFNAESIDALASLSTATTLFGLELGRVGGFIMEPVTAGYMATGALLAIAGLQVAQRSRPRSIFWLAIAANLLVAVTAGTKNTVLMIGIAVLISGLIAALPRLHATFLILAAWGGAFGAVLLYVVLIKSPESLSRVFTDPLSLIGGDSTVIHLAGLIKGVEGAIMNPLGQGLGVGGNFRNNFNESTSRTFASWLGTGAESAIGVLAFQTGIVGLLAFIALVIAFARSWGPWAAIFLGTWSASALFAESMFGPQVASLFMISAALMREPPARFLPFHKIARDDEREINKASPKIR